VNLHTFSDFALYGTKSSYEIYDGFYRGEIAPNTHERGVDLRTILDVARGRRIPPLYFSEIKPRPFAFERATLPPYMRSPQYRARNCSVCAKRAYYTAMGVSVFFVEVKWLERETGRSSTSSTEINILLGEAVLSIIHTNVWSDA
jgi:hypothetical protein